MAPKENIKTVNKNKKTKDSDSKGEKKTKVRDALRIRDISKIKNKQRRTEAFLKLKAFKSKVELTIPHEHVVN